MLFALQKALSEQAQCLLTPVEVTRTNSPRHHISLLSLTCLSSKGRLSSRFFAKEGPLLNKGLTKSQLRYGATRFMSTNQGME